MVAENPTITTPTTSTTRKPKHRKSLFQDSITVEIPIDVTADLGIAIRQTRKKRIAGILELFPSLKKKEVQQETKDEAEEGNDENDNDDSRKEKVDSQYNIPHRHQYGSVLDYLEAKYVRGVMLQEEGDDGTAAGDDQMEEKAGSVYDDSDGSFLDDSMLERDVAEQVISQATHTKLELEEEDADFFVNVGALEVEDHDLIDYDPVQEERLAKKRKLEGSAKKPPAKKAATKQTKTDAETAKANTTTKQSTDAPKATKPSVSADSKTSHDQAQAEVLQQKADALKKVLQQHYNNIAKSIQSMGDDVLPKRKTMEKVSIVVPAGKSAGDDVTFSNPHVPGQKLRVKVPKHTVAGGKFVVSVPVPQVDDGVDRNKFGREWQDSLNAFSQAHDDWSAAHAACKEFNKEKYQLHHERMNKFDDLIKLFPKDLMTPIDAPYMRKIVRRARQAAAKRANKDPGTTLEKVESAVEMVAEKDDAESATLFKGVVPTKGRCFDSFPMDLKLFAQPDQDEEDHAFRPVPAIPAKHDAAKNLPSESTSLNLTKVSSQRNTSKLDSAGSKLSLTEPGITLNEKVEPELSMSSANDATNTTPEAMQYPGKGTAFEKKIFVEEDFLEEPDVKSSMPKID